MWYEELGNGYLGLQNLEEVTRGGQDSTVRCQASDDDDFTLHFNKGVGDLTKIIILNFIL